VKFPLAVAVSGGADSLALMQLTQAYAKEKGGHTITLTVDHGLRPESKDDAQQVQKWAQERGIEHVILTWEGEKPTSHLQEEARKARYALLTDWCKKNQVSTLLLGHHREDQEETFWLRLTCWSGLEGLTGMKQQTSKEGITILRPLLGFPKERLKATLLAENNQWIEDPSNQSKKFFRGRFRTFMSEEGLSSSRLLKVMNKLREDADFIQESLHNAIKETVQLHEEGYITINRRLFEVLHPALQKREIIFLMRWFSGGEYAPRSVQVMNILEKITCPSDMSFSTGLLRSARNDEGGARWTSPFTAGGIYWIPRPNDILLLREKSTMKDTLRLETLEEKTLWDQRFWIDPALKDQVPQETILAPLAHAHHLKKEITSPLPPRVWPTLPALWVEGKVAAIPHLCYDALLCGRDLNKFISLKPLFHDSLRFTI
jgi:tRNA(Ile)-lysidine synthase